MDQTNKKDEEILEGKEPQEEQEGESESTEAGPEEESDYPAQIEQLQKQTLLLRADMENLRKRTAKEKEEIASFATRKFALDLLGVMDNFERALGQVQANEEQDDNKSLIEGIKLTKQELEKVFGNNNITKFKSMEEKFDSNLHQALMEVESDVHEPGVVVQVIQEGYKINNRLLRPAMVGVSKQK